MVKIVADDKIPFLRGALEDVARMVYLPAGRITRSDLMNADALITRTRTQCNEKLLNGTKVKFIASATIGHDHIDAGYCASAGIKWTNAPGCNSGSVRQYMASALAAIWQKEKFTFKDVTLGIVGAGNVGSKVERMARALGMNVLINDPPRERAEGGSNFVSLETVIRQSEILSLHVPLTHDGPDKTYHLVEDDFLSSMKKDSWLINTSRGEVAETTALKHALKSGQLGGAILDVWENEPDIDLELLDMACLATPHIAGYSADGKANGTAMSVQAVSRFFNLGLDGWYPGSIPGAPVSNLKLSTENKVIEEVFAEVSLFAYDIYSDSRRLKSSPGTFEEQRGSYPIRREPGALFVDVVGGNDDNVLLMKELGYNAI